MWNSENKTEIACVLAGMILNENNASIDEFNMKKIFKTSGINVEKYWYFLFPKLSDNINFNNVIGISASEKCKIDDVKNQKDDKSGQAESEKKPDIEKKESEESLSEAKAALESSLEKFNEIKVVGFGETELSRDIIDDINTKIEHEKTEGRIVKSSNERLEGALVDLRQSVMVLYQRIISFHPSLMGENAPKFFDGAADSAVQAAYDTREMTTIAGKIIVRMLDTVGGIENIRNLEDQGFVESEESIRPQSPVRDEFNLGDNNCRVKPKPKESPRLYDADDDESNTIQLNIDNILNEDVEVNERIVPSRSLIKATSEKQANDARRILELEEKKKKIRETCGDNDVMAALESPSKAMKRKQDQASTRMAQHSGPVGLPKSVSVRDDAMTKAHAFLTEVPNLE